MPVPDRQDPLSVSANLFDITSDLAGVFWQPITSHLATVFWWLSGLASSFISRMASCYIRIGTALQMRKRVIRHAMLETLLRGF
jgi:hypothetical protein